VHFFRGVLDRREFSYDICLLEILNVLLWEITVFFGLDYFSNFSESLNYFQGEQCAFFSWSFRIIFRGNAVHFFRGVLDRMKFTYNICLLEIFNVLLWGIIVFFGLAYFSNFF
jgi:hypothetical protein